jgi:hypothetical protein
MTQNQTKRTQASNAQTSTLLKNARLCDAILPFVLGLGCAAVLAVSNTALAGSALASTKYDGDWSGVVIAAHRGACEPTFRYNVQIAHGAINSTAGGTAAQGRVLRTGAVRVLVQSGNEWADGHGHLRGNRGAGVWRG